MIRYLIAGLLAGPLLPTITAAAEFDDLLGRVPDEANAVLVIDAQALWSAPLAQAEGWQSTWGTDFEATALPLPSTARRFVMAAEYDIEFMRPLWEAAVMHVADAPTLQEVAAERDGTLDRLANRDAVWLDRSLLVAFEDRTLGLLTPARRQAAARWIESAQRPDTGRLSPFLLTAAERVSSGEAQVALALELHQVVRPEEVEKKVRESQLVPAAQVNAVTATLTHLRGITLTVRVDEQSLGSLIVDFDQTAQPLAEVAKPLVLAALAKAGGQLEDFRSWEASTSGTQIRLAGPLSASGRKRILSLLALDDDPGLARQPAVADREPRATPPPPPPARRDVPPPPTRRDVPRPSAVAEASRRYFRTVNGILDDLRSPRNDQRLDQVALWIDNYARRIEQMPTRRLDPDVAAYGRLVAQSLHQVVGLIHGVYSNIEYRTAQSGTGVQINVAAVPTWNTVGIGGVGFFREYVPFAAANIDVGARMAERRQVSEEEFAAAQNAAYELMRRIDEEAARLRSELSARYGMEF